LQEAQLAAQLWEDAGLRRACSALRLEDGSSATGLNPNIRLYRWAADGVAARRGAPKQPQNLMELWPGLARARAPSPWRHALPAARRRYGPVQRFGTHIEDSVEVGPSQETGFTLLIYLSCCGTAGHSAR
jgi:hypothetical protein